MAYLAQKDFLQLVADSGINLVEGPYFEVDKRASKAQSLHFSNIIVFFSWFLCLNLILFTEDKLEHLRIRKHALHHGIIFYHVANHWIFFHNLT